MEQIDELFTELEKAMLASKPALKSTLSSGLSRNEIDSYIKKLPFKISPDIISLYEWSSGTGYELEILPGAYLTPLEEAFREFEQRQSMKAELQNIFFQQYYDSFRFLGDYSDGGYAFGRIDSPSKGRIVGLCIHMEWAIAYDSLRDLLKTAITCYKRGVLNKDIETMFKLYFEIGKELNSPLQYWNLTGTQK